MSALDHEPFPKGALIAVGAMVGLTLISTAAVRLVRVNAPALQPASQPAPAAFIDLRFADQADGSIAVTDSRSGRSVATLAPNTNGFVRGVLRGLARDRISRRIGMAPPFRLSQDHQGRLSLQDTATQRRIDLEAFGAGNRESFLSLLPTEGRS